MNKTPIEWTDYSSNPFKARHKLPAPGIDCSRCGMPSRAVAHGKLVNLCVKISPGCKKCYAAALTHRWGGPDYLQRSLECFEPVLVEKELRAILKSKATGVKVFAFDMTDAFLEFWPDEFLDRFFAVAAQRKDLTFQLLTKRPERALRYLSDTREGVPGHSVIQRVANYAQCIVPAAIRRLWPLPNVHLGVSVEDQKTADERIPWLLKTPAATRFISYEPALAAVDWRGSLISKEDRFEYGTGIDWVIVGGESGPGARPFDVQWARDTIAQCKTAGVPVFMKQLGSSPIAGRMPNPADMFIRLKDKKGGDISEFPEDLRVREFPQ